MSQGIKIVNGGHYSQSWVSLDTEQRRLEMCTATDEEALASEGSFRLLQITDCHLGERVGEQLAGMDTDASLDYVLAHIASELALPDAIPAHLLLATGDLANHGNIAAYNRLHSKLASLPIPSVWLPGNHDDAQKMLQVADEQQMPGVVIVGKWAIIMMNSTIPEKVEGEFGRDELNRLADILGRLPFDTHIMICVHHQVLPVGSRWLDQQQIADHDKFIDLLRGEERLRLVVSGHVHQESITRHPALPLVDFVTSPSTCIQFAPVTEDFKIDSQFPGYRWFDLQSDGSYQTGVYRVEGVDLTMDLASSGY